MGDDDCDHLDIKLFIEQIKQHHEIWDIRNNDYKDKEKKQFALEEISATMFQNYCDKSANEKNAIIKKLSLKWRNIKDNYVRCVRKRTKSGQPVRQYIYARQLSFLQESMALADIQSTIEQSHSLDSPASQHQEEELQSHLMISSRPSTPNSSSGRGKAASRRRYELESTLINFMNTPIVVEPPNSDKLFFDSLIPMIDNFTEDEKLELRAEIIEIIRKIKRRSAVPPTAQSNHTETV